MRKVVGLLCLIAGSIPSVAQTFGTGPKLPTNRLQPRSFSQRAKLFPPELAAPKARPETAWTRNYCFPSSVGANIVGPKPCATVPRKSRFVRLFERTAPATRPFKPGELVK